MIPSSFIVSQTNIAPQLTAGDIGFRLLSLILLIAINAFFVAAEFSIVSVRRSRITQLVEAGDVPAQTVQSLQRSIERLLSTTQLGITLSSLALGWIGEGTMAVLVRALLASFPVSPEVSRVLSHSLAVPIAFFLLAYLQIVLGELSPKSLALVNSEQLARVLAPPSLTIARIFNPFIWILNQSTRWLLRLVGVQYTPQGWYNRVTPEELQLIINTERESTGLEAEERELLNNVFEFGEVLVGEIMIPRTSIDAVSNQTTFSQLLEEVTTTGYTRFPVMGESLDDIQGIIDFKALALPLAQAQLSPDTLILPWVRPVRFVPEFMLLSELLPLMQRSHSEMVMVVDEFGGTAGLVTLNDLIAEIIGDEMELNKTEEVALQMLDEQTFLVQAQVDIEEVNELLDLDLPVTDEYHTLGGFLLYQFQKIPIQGETLKYENLEMTVISAEGPRVNQVRIHRQDTLSPDAISDEIIVSETEAIAVEKDLSSESPVLDPQTDSDSQSPTTEN